MGNQVIKDGNQGGGGGTAEMVKQPGKPVVRLASERKSYRRKREREKRDLNQGFEGLDGETPACVSDDILLTWAPCTRGDKGYEIEMWDLGLQEWVRVAATDDHKPECILSNILSGILYRFRVTAVTKDGNVSFPSDPSDAFVLDMPGVNIAPYWIQTPPTIVSLTIDQTLVLQAKALGTPAPNFHWYKDHHEELFITENVQLETSEELSQLTITNMQPSDAGVYTCTAVNTVGKCVWETVVDLKAKPSFTIPPGLRDPITFQEDEIIRIKLPLIGVPEPTLALDRIDKDGKEVAVMASESDAADKEEADLQLMDDFAVLRIDSAQIRHSGKWRITATNPIGSDKAVLEFVVNSRPNPPAGVPQIVDSGANSVKLCWEAAPKSSSSKEDLKYQVEYNREKWDIWLKGRVTGDLEATVTDLIPGSYYRFRVRTVTETGTSEPGAISEQVFLGAPMEDEVFGLPGGNYPKESSQLAGQTSSKVFSSSRPSRPRHLSWNHVDNCEGATTTTTVAPTPPTPSSAMTTTATLPTPSATQDAVPSPSRSPKKNRQSSLDREVYYLDGNREEVVTYAPPPGGATYSKLVSPTLARKRGMSQEEEERFRASLGNLCAALMKASQTSLNKVGEKSIAPTQQQVPAAGSRGDRPTHQNRDSRPTGPSTREYLPTKRLERRTPSNPDVEKVFQRYDRVSVDKDQPNSSVSSGVANPRQDMTEVEKKRLQSSMTDLCNRLRAISSQNLVAGGQATRSQEGDNSHIDEAEELERRTGDTFDHNASIKEELKTLSSGSPALHRSSPAKSSSPNLNHAKTLAEAAAGAGAKGSRPLLKNQGSTSFEDSAKTMEAGSFDYSTDNYLSDISCDIP